MIGARTVAPSAQAALAHRPGLLHLAFTAVYPRREAECRAADEAEATWDRDHFSAAAAAQNDGSQQ